MLEEVSEHACECYSSRVVASEALLGVFNEKIFSACMLLSEQSERDALECSLYLIKYMWGIVLFVVVVFHPKNTLLGL